MPLQIMIRNRLKKVTFLKLFSDTFDEQFMSTMNRKLFKVI